MLFSSVSSEFNWWVTNNSTPSVNMGTAITPGTAPAWGTWTQLIPSTSVTEDVYGVLICINSFSTSATVRNVLIDIGADNSGGGTYRTLIPYLMGGHASNYDLGGIWYYFPLFISKGQAIGARAMGNAISAGRILITLFGQPKNPDSVKVGTKVFSFGETTSTATGTAYTLSTSLGANTQVGSATTMPLWWWQCGYTSIDSTITPQKCIHLNVLGGDATNKKYLLQNVPIVATTVEQIMLIPYLNGYNTLASGQNVYMSAHSLGAADTSPSVMCWGLGG